MLKKLLLELPNKGAIRVITNSDTYTILLLLSK